MSEFVGVAMQVGLPGAVLFIVAGWCVEAARRKRGQQRMNYALEVWRWRIEKQRVEEELAGEKDVSQQQRLQARLVAVAQTLSAYEALAELQGRPYELSPRAEEIIRRRLKGDTFASIAADMGITRQRVHQIWRYLDVQP